jgi:hypothetical protein
VPGGVPRQRDRSGLSRRAESLHARRHGHRDRDHGDTGGNRAAAPRADRAPAPQDGIYRNGPVLDLAGLFAQSLPQDALFGAVH